MTKFNRIKVIAFCIAIVAVLVGYSEVVTTTYDDEQQVLVDPTQIPVTMPDIQIPVVNVPVVDVPVVEKVKTGEIALVMNTVGSYPYTFYTESQSITVDDYDKVLRDDATGSVLLADVADNRLYVTVEVINTNGETFRLNDVVPASVKIADVTTYTFDNGTTAINVKDGKVQLYNVQTGTVVSPEVRLVQVDGGAVMLVDVATGQVRSIDISAATVDVVNIATPEVYDPNNRIVELTKLFAKLNKYVKDKRTFDTDTSISIDNEAIYKWIKIYESNLSYEMQFVKPKSKIRMIAEARVPEDNEQYARLKSNLNFYKQKGYNSVLMPFYANESVHNLSTLADLIKSYGFDLYITYSGPESLRDTVFKDPDKIKYIINVLAPKAKGCLIGWRRTSVHLFLQDPVFSSYIIKCMRESNPTIEVYGEGYFGATAETKESQRKVTYNMPKNVSGCILENIGYSNVNVKGVLNGLFADVKNVKRIAVVVGEHPYYKSTNNNKKSFSANLLIKKNIEDRLLKSGVFGTITLHGDGGDSRGSDNLSVTNRN